MCILMLGPLVLLRLDLALLDLTLLDILALTPCPAARPWTSTAWAGVANCLEEVYGLIYAQDGPLLSHIDTALLEVDLAYLIEITF